MKYSLAFILLLSLAARAQHKFIQFTPTSFSNLFTLNQPPALTINAGDTVSTETIDAMGYDKNSVKRQKGGNPLTGPFIINDAKAGDIIAVTLNKVALNRNYAKTSEAIAGRSVTKTTSSQFGKKFRLVKWKLDIANGYAVVDDSIYTNLNSFKVPVHPFLGCIGVAPLTKKNEILSFFQGEFGGNLDFSSITQGSTVYLPVLHDGAYLYFGDGHALQGDGEIAGNALETSMDIEFTVKLISKPAESLTSPRVENASHIMAIGTSKNIDDALKQSTDELLKWLQQEYKLTLQEAGQVVSTSIEYTVAEIADPNVAIVAKLKKELLKGLTRKE
ncbi:MAG: acetamidase/formamidase family protein [Chitinophagaceae bacterium]